jgi:RluA family pseudouridine synthase
LWIVHRLDRQTSGTLVLARTAETHRVLNAQFQERQVTKTYHALVNGTPAWQEQVAELALLRDGDRRHRTIIDDLRGKPSITHLRVLERFARHTLLEALPKTGRTHQIRAHLAALGFPIVADALYRGGNSLSLANLQGQHAPRKTPEPLIERVALHALSLVIVHPASNEPMRFTAPYPADLNEALSCLRTIGSKP